PQFATHQLSVLSLSARRMRMATAKPTVKVRAGLPHVPALYQLKPRTEYLPWSHAEERLERSRNYWICTARPDGRPHSIPVWGFWIEDAFYFGTARVRKKAKTWRRILRYPYTSSRGTMW